MKPLPNCLSCGSDDLNEPFDAKPGMILDCGVCESRHHSLGNKWVCSDQGDLEACRCAQNMVSDEFDDGKDGVA